MKKNQTKKQLQAIISTYQDCTFLLVSALNDYADSVGVKCYRKGFRLESSYGSQDYACYLETPEGYSGPLFDYQDRDAISAFLGMIQQAQATKEQQS
jgi:hypothetical protein|tara:strand:+ start:727 stop:1017 length:291 start_codon:yes stop_codon:yes gene_type:complete